MEEADKGSLMTTVSYEWVNVSCGTSSLCCSVKIQRAVKHCCVYLDSNSFTSYVVIFQLSCTCWYNAVVQYQIRHVYHFIASHLCG